MKATYSFFLIVTLIFQLKSFTAFSQQIKFKKTEYAVGSSFSTVSAICQDPKGYMWFAIGNTGGLFRYDGYEVVSFKHNDANPGSLANNWVECLYIDSDGILWVGTFGYGMDRFDPGTGIFTHFHNDPKNPSSLGNDTVTVITKDHEGTMWVGDYMGLERFDSKTGRFTHFAPKKNDSTSLSNNEVRAIYEDKQGTLWVGTGSPWSSQGADAGGLNRLNRWNGTFIRYLNNPKDSNSLINDKVRAIFEDSYGTFWVGTSGDGLHTMDRETGTFHRHLYNPLHPEKLSRPPINENTADHITFISEDVSGKIWIGTQGAGINRYDPKNQMVTYYGVKDSARGFKDVQTWCAYTSRDGIQWIGGFNGDLYKVDLLNADVPHYPLNRTAICFSEDKDAFWIGTDSGLIRKDNLNGNIEWFVYNSNKQESLSNNIISSLQVDSSGDIWIGTVGGGVNYYNHITRSFSAYHNLKNSNSLVCDTITSIFLNKKQNLWIGTYLGLDFLNKETKEFKHFQHDPKNINTISEYWINSIYEDAKDRVWIGYVTGLDKLDPNTGNVEHYFEGDVVSSIFQDSQGNIWVGNPNGLYEFDEGSKLFSPVVNPSTGKEFPFVSTIAGDNENNIWFTSVLGITKYNVKEKEAITYGEQYGVKGQELSGEIFKNNKGQLFFGDSYGYFAFYPEQLSKNSKPPQILINEFRLNNKIVEPGNNSPLKVELWKTKEISLNYDQNIFSFGFTVIDYANPSLNQLLYKVENYDNDWRTTGSERSGNYFNVPPGKYILKVKASNSTGKWAEKDITIYISPPWWRTWWAYSLFAILFIATIWGIIYYRSKSLLRDKKNLETKVSLRTAEVLKQKEEIAEQRDNLEQTLSELKSTQSQLVQREKMASLGELTAGIAHEIQNPLNFVNNFSELNKELIGEMKAEIENGNLEEVKILAADIETNEEKINHHGKRADAIVKGMLQHSGTSTGAKEPTDINALCDEYLRLSYHGLRAKDKDFNADFKTDFDESIGNINIIPQDIGRVILNLINNAFYAVSEKKKKSGEDYEPTVTVATRSIQPPSGGLGIQIKVSDNGNGIPQKILDKIFQPFFTTKPTGQGTGLGLSLSYDIIKAHGGEIKVETKEGEGTTFIIQLAV